MQETQVQSLGQEDIQEEGVAIHSSILAWRSPWTEEPCGLQSTGSLRVRHDRNDLAGTHAHTSVQLDDQGGISSPEVGIDSSGQEVIDVVEVSRSMSVGQLGLKWTFTQRTG